MRTYYKARYRPGTVRCSVCKGDVEFANAFQEKGHNRTYTCNDCVDRRVNMGLAVARR